MDKWILEYSSTNDTDDLGSLEELKTLNNNLRIKLQALIDANANKETNDVLNQKAKDVEIESLRIFGNLNHLKKDKCKRG